MDWAARLALGVMMLAPATCAVLIAVAGTRAIAERRYTTEVTWTHQTSVVGVRVAGAEGRETLAFVGGDAVRVGVGLIACSVMLASWAVALGAMIASRHRRAHFLIGSPRPKHPRIQVGRGRGAEAGCSSTRSGPPARLQPARAIHVAGAAVAGGASVIAGACCHPEKCGPELRGSTHAGARRCLRKLSST